MREALAAYLADTPPTAPPTPADSPLTAVAPTGADSADRLRALEERLTALAERMDALERVPTPRRQLADRRADTPLTVPADSVPTGADTAPQPYDPVVALARMQALKAA
jgi:hypothetical protein